MTTGSLHISSKAIQRKTGPCYSPRGGKPKRGNVRLTTGVCQKARYRPVVRTENCSPRRGPDLPARHPSRCAGHKEHFSTIIVKPPGPNILGFNETLVARVWSFLYIHFADVVIIPLTSSYVLIMCRQCNLGRHDHQCTRHHGGEFGEAGWRFRCPSIAKITHCSAPAVNLTGLVLDRGKQHSAFRCAFMRSLN